MVHVLVGAAVIATCHHIYHGVVFIFTKWGIDAHVMSACHDALRDFIFIYSGSCRDFLHARASLVLLLKLVDSWFTLLSEPTWFKGSLTMRLCSAIA